MQSPLQRSSISGSQNFLNGLGAILMSMLKERLKAGVARKGWIEGEYGNGGAE